MARRGGKPTGKPQEQALQGVELKIDRTEPPTELEDLNEEDPE